MSRLETNTGLIAELIASARALEPKALVLPSALPPEVVRERPRRIWEDSAAYTQFLLEWDARPKIVGIAQVFANELRRRQGLRAYGIRTPSAKRRSKINALGPVQALVPRAFSPVAKPEAA